MSYNNPLTISYNLGEHDFGAGGDALGIKAPKGYNHGVIKEVGVVVTETFTNTTTPAYVRLGTASDADAYAELNMGTAADTNFYGTADDTDAIISANVTNEQIEVAFVAPTGGTPAGKGHVVVVINWF